MQDHHRKPLQPLSANAVAPPSALNRLENIALGGKAGLKLRRPGGSSSCSSRSRSGSALPSADSPMSAGDNSTFALSTDVSFASIQLADDGRQEPLFGSTPVSKVAKVHLESTQAFAESRRHAAVPKVGAVVAVLPVLLYTAIVDLTFCFCLFIPVAEHARAEIFQRVCDRV